MRLVICECPKCITYTRINDKGESVNGQMVHISTRQRHWAHQDPETEEAIVRGMFPKLFAKSPDSTINKSNNDDESSSEESKRSETISTYTIIQHIMYFLAWMYLICGVSQANCRVAREYLVAIALMAFKNRTEEDLEDEILNDVRSITKRLNLHPTTDSYACCQNCYSLYDIEYGPFRVRLSRATIH
ncbi:hypothetical protein DFH28DRAFT_1146237 [Melampsora americana]|nr:hypothetical protein DFH28DRAFT_1146237 [Melampsora americana]